MSEKPGKIKSFLTRLPLLILVAFIPYFIVGDAGFLLEIPLLHIGESSQTSGWEMYEVGRITGSFFMFLLVGAYILFAFTNGLHMTRRQSIALLIGLVYPFFGEAKLSVTTAANNTELILDLSSTDVIFHVLSAIMMLLYVIWYVAKSLRIERS